MLVLLRAQHKFRLRIRKTLCTFRAPIKVAYSIAAQPMCYEIMVTVFFTNNIKQFKKLQFLVSVELQVVSYTHRAPTINSCSLSRDCCNLAACRSANYTTPFNWEAEKRVAVEICRLASEARSYEQTRIIAVVADIALLRVHVVCSILPYTATAVCQIFTGAKNISDGRFFRKKKQFVSSTIFLCNQQVLRVST